MKMKKLEHGIVNRHPRMVVKHGNKHTQDHPVEVSRPKAVSARLRHTCFRI